MVPLGQFPTQPRDFAVAPLTEQNEPEAERQRDQEQCREREGRAGGGDERGEASPKCDWALVCFPDRAQFRSDLRGVRRNGRGQDRFRLFGQGPERAQDAILFGAIRTGGQMACRLRALLLAHFSSDYAHELLLAETPRLSRRRARRLFLPNLFESRFSQFHSEYSTPALRRSSRRSFNPR